MAAPTLLAAYSTNAALLDLRDRTLHRGHVWQKSLEVGAADLKDYDSDLVWHCVAEASEILINREQHVELFRSQGQELPVRGSGPADLLHRPRFKLG